jgi:hypothetical protein
LDAHVMDGEALPCRNEFDAVFSNAVLHWIKRADPMIYGVTSKVMAAIRSFSSRSARAWRAW